MEINVEQKMKGEVSRRKCNTSDASFAYIPEEIQIEILSWLPSKSLSRCKCVSKLWNTTLTIQAFLVRHSRSYGKHPKHWFVVNSIMWGPVTSFELNDDNTPKTTTWPAVAKPRIRGKDLYSTDFPIRNYRFMSNICNDLICAFKPSSTRVGLLNIKTRDFIRLPPITKKSMSAFTSWYSLGFDPVHQVFKVLSISYRIASKECPIVMVAVLTVGSNYWNPIDYESLPSSVIKDSPIWNTGSDCIDGVIYSVYKNKINNPTVLTVTAFDLTREAFRDNELVTPMRNWPFMRYCVAWLKECPTLFIWTREGDETEEVEQWTLFNHKNPNAAWKRSNFTNHNIQTMLPYDYITYVASGSTLLQYSETINSEAWYSLYDLEKFAIEYNI